MKTTKASRAQENSNSVVVRRGLIDHVVQGHLTLIQFAVFQMMLLLADETGVLTTNASSMCSLFKKSRIPLSTMQAVFLALEKGGYIERNISFGQSAGYAISIPKYQAADRTGETSNGQ